MKIYKENQKQLKKDNDRIWKENVKYSALKNLKQLGGVRLIP